MNKELDGNLKKDKFIRIAGATRENLKAWGRKGESYDDVINRFVPPWVGFDKRYQTPFNPPKTQEERANAERGGRKPVE